MAPFHQWTPDVYEGAPTPVTAFMAVTTKVAAFGVFLRLFDVALIGAQPSWGPALAALAAITILVGNVGALGQSSLKRMLAYSSVGQAGYMLVGVVVATRLGAQATVFYLAMYLFMNMAAFSVIVARERETGLGDSIGAMAGLGRERPWLAVPMTLSMLALAGIPATAGFIGKFYLIDAAVSGGYAWLGVMIVVGSMISLGYYLPVIAAMWMREAPADAPVSPESPVSTGGPLPALAGGSPELDGEVSGGAPSRRSCSWRSRLARRRSSSGSSPSPCSTSSTTSPARSPGCSDAVNTMAIERCSRAHRHDATATDAASALQPPGGLGGGFGFLELALDEIEPGLPEAGVGEVDADDLPQLLGATRAAGGEHLEVLRHAARRRPAGSARRRTAPAAVRRRRRRRSRGCR